MLSKDNYVEHIYASDLEHLQFDVSPEVFQAKLQHVIKKKSQGQGIEKQIVRYLFQDLIYEIEDVTKIRTYRKKPIHVDTDSATRTIVCKYLKEKIPYHMFPSTQSLEQVIKIHCTSFKIQQNVFVNFEEQSDKDEVKVRKIYIHVNKETKLDPVLMEKALADALKLIA